MCVCMNVCICRDHSLSILFRDILDTFGLPFKGNGIMNSNKTKEINIREKVMYVCMCVWIKGMYVYVCMHVCIYMNCLLTIRSIRIFYISYELMKKWYEFVYVCVWICLCVYMYICKNHSLSIRFRWVWRKGYVCVCTCIYVATIHYWFWFKCVWRKKNVCVYKYICM